MISTTAAYKSAIIADSRKTLVRVVIDLIDPDIVYNAGTSSGATAYSDLDQLHDKEMETGTPYATLELNRWLLNGTQTIAPPDADTQVGFESSNLADVDGFGSFWVQLNFSGVSILQACSIYFPDDNYNGVPTDFTVDIYSGGSIVYTETFSGNTNSVVNLTGFTVNNPDAIRVTVTRMSLPYRRMRVPEIIAGIYEAWDNSDLAEFAITNQADFTALTAPYGTCRLAVDNSNQRFSPRNKSGLFASLEERQGLQTYIGVDGGEYVPTGIYYQYSGGWNTGNVGLTMTWNLVDIIGLLASRKFQAPSPLPTTLEAWVAAIVAQLGTNFAGLYTLDGVDGTLSLTATADDIADATCGQILMWICQRACCFMRASAETGKLVLSASFPAGNSYTLDNLSAYPTELANNDVAAIIFSLPNDVEETVAGTSPTSPTTVSISNPFITTAAQAQDTAAWILQFYGGNRIETTGRGDPSTEIGDVVTVSFDNADTEQGQVIYQSFTIRQGVMQGCQSKMIEVST